MVLFLVVILRLSYLQVIAAQYYEKQAQKLRSQSVVLYSRGRILDRNGVVLAQDTILYDVYAHPHYYHSSLPEEMAKKMSPILGMSEDELLKKLKLPYDTISLKKDITKTSAEAIRKLQFPGIDVPRKMIRQYPQGTLASQVIGYVNDDASISSGVEKTAEKTLRTPPKIPGLELNGHGDFVNVSNINPDVVTSLPKAEDVHLTIDARVQFAAESALAEGLTKYKAKRGTVIVMNPRNGEVLAFAAIPDFDPEHYYKADPASLTNWALTDVYPPGSTFKILTVASGLETGVINKDSTIHDTGILKMNGFTIKNYDYAKRGAPGDINLVQLFVHSSNIGSLLISLMMDPTDHYKLLRAFGMGQKTNIDLPGESGGIIHPPQKWDTLTHATIGFGYGLAATPIQMVAAVASIANDGVWVTPHVLQDEKNLVRRRVISEKTAHTVTELLAESNEATSVSEERLDGFRVAGKTGTSRKPADNGKGYSNQVFTSFIGYFPAEDPQVLMMVVIDSPGIGEAWGSTVAVPIFNKIANQCIGYLGLKPNPALMVTKTMPSKKST